MGTQLSNNKPPRNKTKKFKYLLSCKRFCLQGSRKKCQIAPAKMDSSLTFLILLCTPAIFCAETCGKDAEGGALQSDAKASGHSLQWTKALISKTTPYFEGTAVVNGQMKELKVTDYRGKYLVFFFYPLAFTFVCPTEILAFNDRIEEFRALNAEVVACSVDSHFTQLAWTNVPRKEGGLGPLNIPLLADITHKISKDYGVYLEDNGHSLRGLFIIDDKGVLRQITMNDLPVGRSVDETLRLLQAFQHTDKHGEVCPADWTPGKATIIPDPLEKMKYFEGANKN